MTVTRDDVRARLETLLESIPAGGRLPGERELSRTWGVARMTLRRAVDGLVVDGRIERRVGSGTFAVRPPMARVLGLTSFTEDVTRRGGVQGATVVDFRVLAATPETASRLAMPEGDDVLRISRVRTSDGDPVALETVEIPVGYVPGLTDADVTGSLYGVLSSRYGIRVRSAAMTLGAAMPDRAATRLLAMDQGIPCLVVDMTDVDTSGRTVMHARCQYRADRYRMTVNVATTSNGATW